MSVGRYRCGCVRSAVFKPSIIFVRLSCSFSLSGYESFAHNRTSTHTQKKSNLSSRRRSHPRERLHLIDVALDVLIRVTISLVGMRLREKRAIQTCVTRVTPPKLITNKAGAGNNARTTGDNDRGRGAITIATARGCYTDSPISRSRGNARARG